MKAFFDIDTQIDFLFPAGALYGAGAERVIPAVARLNHHAAERGIPLISTACAHPEDAREFGTWAPHCVVGTVGQGKPQTTLLPKRVTIPNRRADFALGDAQQIILEKDDIDMFANPNVPALLERLEIDECVVYGVFTEFCVKCAIKGLLKHGLRVSLVTEATAHLSETAGEEVLRRFTESGGKRIALADALQSQ
jgi:nicotinamidase/pyrazinamidase